MTFCKLSETICTFAVLKIGTTKTPARTEAGTPHVSYLPTTSYETTSESIAASQSRAVDLDPDVACSTRRLPLFRS